MWKDLHRELAPPGRYDGPDVRVDQQTAQLIGSLPGRGADDPDPVHAPADDDVVPASA